MPHMKVNAALVTTPPQYSESSSWNHSGSVTSPRIVLGDDEHLPYTCPQCGVVDPTWQCDSCEGCDECTEQCSLCASNCCSDCCDADTHSTEE